ncbi:hypothetical protein J3D54_002358 [Pseudomonas sp. GGS8]|nr:hypothetical protein [Pseudomonas sp. GGS8]
MSLNLRLIFATVEPLLAMAANAPSYQADVLTLQSLIRI